MYVQLFSLFFPVAMLDTTLVVGKKKRKKTQQQHTHTHTRTLSKKKKKGRREERSRLHFAPFA